MERSVAYSMKGTRWILVCVALATFMSNLDISIVNISLPAISKYFDAGIGIVSRIVLVYFLIMVGLLLVFGKLGDLKGFKKIFVTGFAVFTLGSLLCGIAGSINQLIVFRVVQAIGGSIMTALAPAIISAFIPPEARGKALGWVAVFAALGISAGPAIGGIITEYLSWHWIFLINVPIGAGAIIMVCRILPRQDRGPSRAPFDIPGAFFLFLLFTSLIYALNMGQERGWTSPLILGCFACACVCACCFVMVERRSADPLIDPGLFRNRNFVWGNLAGFFVLMGLNGMIFLLPFYLEITRSLPMNRAGLIMVIPSGIMMLINPLAGGAADRVGSRLLSSGGMFLCAGAFAMLSLFNAHTPIWFILFSLTWFGLTAGFFMAPNGRLVMTSCPEEKQGVASSIMMLVRIGGGLMGTCTFEAIFSGALPQQISLQNIAPSHPSIAPDLLTGGFHRAFLVGVLICLAAALCSALIREK